jgi:hypothetical protein
MSVSLLVRSGPTDEQRLVPVAVQPIFVSKWLPGASALELDWVGMMETGFDVTDENRDELIQQLEKLRGWMTISHSAEVDRLDQLLAELRGLRFDLGASAFLG